MKTQNFILILALCLFVAFIFFVNNRSDEDYLPSQYGFGYFKDGKIEIFDEIIEPRKGEIEFIKVNAVLYSIRLGDRPYLQSMTWHDCGAAAEKMSYDGLRGRRPHPELYERDLEVSREFDERVRRLNAAGISADSWGGFAWCEADLDDSQAVFFRLGEGTFSGTNKNLTTLIDRFTVVF